jgi:dehydrogenase/reductase SDR family protein 4
VGKEEQLDALVEQTMEKYGRIDVLVNNAAVNPFWGPVEQVEKPLFDKIMSTNTWAPLALSQRVFPHMQKQGGGSIINISSVEGLRATFGVSAYSTSKAALLMVSSNLAIEWGPYNIRVNTVCPGLVKTKLSQALWSNESVLKQYESSVPLQRMAMPDELAGVAVFLASDAASYITGGVFSVDGGYMQS